ncbi:hypothetical protein GHT06_016427 [Daphnia sinensis]|uniref:Uncharacterized protein n=1 Tax=Daphnia sinensis TaxID=1820382 RepID=A0AAD5PRF5_9CRUS|nr:hypothetical protein GHT06_016427 [Daphnia sinensis]
MAAVVPPPAHGQPQQHHQRLNKMTDLTDMWQDIESVLLDEGPNAGVASAGHASGGADPLAYHHYHAIHHPIAAHQMSLVHPGFQQHPINHQGATYGDVTGEPVIKNEPVDLMSHQTGETSGSYNFGNNAAGHHLQYHVQQHHYYPSSSFHHQANPSADQHAGYARSTSTARDCLYQPAGSSHHARASSNPSISSPSPSPNSSNSNSSYAGFGQHHHHHHHPSAYAYGQVAVPLAHNGLHHQQGVLATSHHHLTASAGRYVHHPFGRHHPPARVSVSTPPCSPQVTAETLNSVHHHNQMQLHHHHSHVSHPSTSQQPPPTAQTSAGPAGPLIKSKRGQHKIDFRSSTYWNNKKNDKGNGTKERRSVVLTKQKHLCCVYVFLFKTFELMCMQKKNRLIITCIYFQLARGRNLGREIVNVYKLNACCCHGLPV